MAGTAVANTKITTTLHLILTSTLIEELQRKSMSMDLMNDWNPDRRVDPLPPKKRQ